MEQIIQAINNFFGFVIPISDFFWEFPTNFSWYKNLPVIGNFSLAIILLVGSGIYFSFRTGFIQVTHFKKGITLLAKKKSEETGISSLASFLLSSAMRVGPGNILGVTGAIAVGGPGALFWMWISAFFGMATAYTEAVLSQIFKEKKNDEFVGGLPFYGKRLHESGHLSAHVVVRGKSNGQCGHLALRTSADKHHQELCRKHRPGRGDFHPHFRFSVDVGNR